MYILCHKCQGKLTGPMDSGLKNCRCISGWVRGFEEPLTLVQAQAAQHAANERDRSLYIRQGRSAAEIAALCD